MFGAILGGIGAIASAFGGSKKQETTTTSHVDYQRMVREAEAAGFNPLTALRNGGSAGFSVSNSVVPALSSAQTIGNVLGAAGNFITNFDPMADDRKQLEFDLVQAQLDNLQANTAATRRSMSFNIPTYTAGENYRQMGSRRTASNAGDWDGRPMTPENAPPVATNPWTKDSGIYVDPNASDASMFEERYGEGIGTVIGGPITLGRDVRRNLIENFGVPAMAISPSHWPGAVSDWFSDQRERAHTLLPTLIQKDRRF